MAYRQSQGLVEDFFGIGLTSRKNLCLNPKVSKEKKGKVVDSKCRNLTASWVRAKAGVNRTGGDQQQQQAHDGDDPMDVDSQRNDVELCNFYEVIAKRIYCGNSSFTDTRTRHWNLPIHPIPFQMVYTRLKTWKRMENRCSTVLITLCDELWVDVKPLTCCMNLMITTTRFHLPMWWFTRTITCWIPK